ncbi:hypothetical protein H0H93_016379 [Arthromyces matolae]|nr:hypothetical protein H0H93_016379 [Arthromyces matolae]
MKTSTINLLFLVVFALAASSTPVPMVQNLAPRAGPEPSRHQLSEGVYSYQINGKTYTHVEVLSAMRLINDTQDGKSHPTTEELANARLLFIESTYLNYVHNPDFEEFYDANRLSMHRFMKFLVGILQERGDPDTNGVKSRAYIRLKTYLKWERDHKCGDSFPMKGNGDLYDLEYLKKLDSALRTLITHEELVEKCNDTLAGKPEANLVARTTDSGET